MSALGTDRECPDHESMARTKIDLNEWTPEPREPGFFSVRRGGGNRPGLRHRLVIFDGYVECTACGLARRKGFDFPAQRKRMMREACAGSPLTRFAFPGGTFSAGFSDPRAVGLPGSPGLDSLHSLQITNGNGKRPMPVPSVSSAEAETCTDLDTRPKKLEPICPIVVWSRAKRYKAWDDSVVFEAVAGGVSGQGFDDGYDDCGGDGLGPGDDCKVSVGSGSSVVSSLGRSFPVNN